MPKKHTAEDLEDLLYVIKLYKKYRSFQTILEQLKKDHRLTHLIDPNAADATKKLRDWFRNNIQKKDAWARRAFVRAAFRPDPRKSKEANAEAEAVHAREQQDLYDKHQEVSLLVKQLDGEETLLSTASQDEQNPDAPPIVAQPKSGEDLSPIRNAAEEHKRKRDANTTARREVRSLLRHLTSC